MRSADLQGILRGLFARRTRPAPGRAELSERLVARHEARYPTGRTPLMATLLKRPVLALLLVSVVGIAACTVPTETEVEMGQRLTYAIDGGEALDQVHAAAAYLESRPGVDGVNVLVEEVDGGPMTAGLMVWGRGVDGAALKDELAGRWPALADARPSLEPVTTDVRTSLAEKVGHRLFEIDVMDGTPEEIRATILEQIYASGFEGRVDVQVDEADGALTIDVEMTDDVNMVENEDTIILEFKSDGE